MYEPRILPVGLALASVEVRYEPPAVSEIRDDVSVHLPHVAGRRAAREGLWGAPVLGDVCAGVLGCRQVPQYQSQAPGELCVLTHVVVPLPHPAGRCLVVAYEDLHGGHLAVAEHGEGIIQNRNVPRLPSPQRILRQGAVDRLLPEEVGAYLEIPHVDGEARDEVRLIARAAVLQVPSREGDGRGGTAVRDEPHICPLRVPVVSPFLVGHPALGAEGVLVLDLAPEQRVFSIRLLDRIEGLADLRRAGPDPARLYAEAHPGGAELERQLACRRHRYRVGAGDRRLARQILLEDPRPVEGAESPVVFHQN